MDVGLENGYPSAMGESGVVAIIVALAVLGSVGIIVAVARGFRSHDPARSRAHVEIDSDGTFTLDVPASPAPESVFFRFEISGTNTDDDFDLAVGAELEGEKGSKVERHHGDKAPSLGYGKPTRLGTQHAVTMTSGSFLLLHLPTNRAVKVKGVARAGGETKLVRGHVYLGQGD